MEGVLRGHVWSPVQSPSSNTLDSGWMAVGILAAPREGALKIWIKEDHRVALARVGLASCSPETSSWLAD
jgi:hypothetical protein